MVVIKCIPPETAGSVSASDEAWSRGWPRAGCLVGDRFYLPALMYSEDFPPMAMTYFPFTGWYPGLGRGAPLKENRVRKPDWDA